MFVSFPFSAEGTSPAALGGGVLYIPSDCEYTTSEKVVKKKNVNIGH